MQNTMFRNETPVQLPTNWVQTGFSPLWLVLKAVEAVVKRVRSNQA